MRGINRKILNSGKFVEKTAVERPDLIARFFCQQSDLHITYKKWHQQIIKQRLRNDNVTHIPVSLWVLVPTEGIKSDFPILSSFLRNFLRMTPVVRITKNPSKNKSTGTRKQKDPKKKRKGSKKKENKNKREERGKRKIFALKSHSLNFRN